MNHKRLIRFLFLAAVAALSGTAAAADLYVPVPYATIQAAVDAANPLGGDVIYVAAGDYPNPVNLNKPVTLRGANWGVHPAVGTHPTELVGVRGPETNLTHDGLYALRPAADGITIDGFRFTGDGGRFLDTYDDANAMHITNCIVDAYGTPSGQGYLQFGGGSHTDFLMDFNLVQLTGDVAFFYTGGGPWDDMALEYNLFSTEGDLVFWTATPLSGGVIRGNEFDGTIGGVPGTGFCTVNIGQGGDLLIEDNYVHDIWYTAFQVGIIGGSVLNNVFERMYPYTGYGADCLQLWGGQWGTAVSQDVTITGNTFGLQRCPGHCRADSRHSSARARDRCRYRRHDDPHQLQRFRQRPVGSRWLRHPPPGRPDNQRRRGRELLRHHRRRDHRQLDEWPGHLLAVARRAVSDRKPHLPAR